MSLIELSNNGRCITIEANTVDTVTDGGSERRVFTNGSEDSYVTDSRPFEVLVADINNRKAPDYLDVFNMVERLVSQLRELTLASEGK
jgi:hypothetical protein